ncbi:MAG: glycosyltransferase family 4 protein [Myxococcota bacterium]
MPRRPEHNPLRVLFVNPFAQRLSGPDESLLLLLRHLESAVDATVALPPGSPFRERYLAAGASLVELPLSRIQRFTSPGEMTAYVGRLAAATVRLGRVVRHLRPQLVHCNMEVCLEAGVAARLSGVPSVYHYRGNTLDDPRRVFDVLTRVWTTLADHLFAISEGCADVFRRRGLGDRVEVLYNALELDDFTRPRDPSGTRRALGIPPNDTVVLTVGRLHPRKDHETLLRAAAASTASPKPWWLVAGSPDGPDAAAYEARMRGLARELGLGERVRFLGARDDVPDLLAASDVFVMTSRHEGFGRAAAEAMAAGKPCVLTDEGAFPELIDPGTHGLLCPPGDATAFARAIDALLGAPERRRAMGEQARRRAVERYDARRQAERVLATYHALVARAPAPAAPRDPRFEASP